MKYIRKFFPKLRIIRKIIRDGKHKFELISSYIYNGQEPIRQDVFKCLDNRPSILKAREIGERIIVILLEF